MSLKPTITGARFDKDRYEPGEKMSVTLDIEVDEVATLLVGMSAPNGAQTKAIVVDYPGIRYFSDYGSDGGDADALTEPTAPRTGKLADTPLWALCHLSWKDDPALARSFLDTADPARMYVLNWYREPMDRVDPATYRANGRAVASIIDAHPRRECVHGSGPILTRYWLDERAGDPSIWSYEGATMVGVDCYMNKPDAADYWTGEKMFGLSLHKLRTAFPGAVFFIPEYGMTRLVKDSTGSGRAEAMLSHWDWLRQQDDVGGWAYWNSQVTGADYRIAAGSPEATAWRHIQESQ